VRVLLADERHAYDAEASLCEAREFKKPILANQLLARPLHGKAGIGVRLARRIHQPRVFNKCAAWECWLLQLITSRDVVCFGIPACPTVQYIRYAVGREPTTTQRLLQKAAALMGEEDLAIALKVPRHLLQAWMSGHATMPDRKLMLLIDALDKFAGK
jgi:hypothetical protein